MEEIKCKKLVGERALFNVNDLLIDNCIFADGESPLKESSNLKIINTTFDWKYPLWYGKNIKVTDSTFSKTARAGIWYTKNITVADCVYDAPKGFRRCSNLTLKNINFTNGEETLWHCKNVKLINVKVDKTYFASDCEDIDVDNITLNGDYGFDSCKNLTITNSTLNTRDAFWNCENVTVINSTINGEYLAWNSKNVTFVNCKINSLQGLCYIDNLVLKNCSLEDTNLAFEYSSVNAEINGDIISVKNPKSGVIKCNKINELILENDKVDTEKTKFIIGD